MKKKRESICDASINEKTPMKDSIQIVPESVLDLKFLFRRINFFWQNQGNPYLFICSIVAVI